MHGASDSFAPQQGWRGVAWVVVDDESGRDKTVRVGTRGSVSECSTVAR